MDELTLTPAQEQLLRDQVIDAQHPGSVLHDFQVVLDYVGLGGVPAAGKHNLLPIAAIDELDQRLSRPLRLSLKRPLLRSHPYLLGLHLLLRATGLARVEGTGAKARLVLDPALLESWNRLNPTEQFFTLLEAWLLNGTADMVGERGHDRGEFLHRCLTTWRYLSTTRNTFDTSRPQDVYVLSIGRNFYLLALMDLFGLAAVEHPRQPVQSWYPAAVRHTPFGDAVFTLLAQSFLDSLYDEEASPPAEGSAFGRLQPFFQPYFPEWQANLTLPEAEPRTGVFVFHVSLGEEVWRRIAIAAKSTLNTLAGTILRSVSFDDDHLYEFIYRDRFGAKVRASHPFCEEGPWTDRVRIGELPLEPGQSMTFHYDFGDDWRFDVTLERIDTPGEHGKLPRVLEKHGKAPQQYPDSGW